MLVSLCSTITQFETIRMRPQTVHSRHLNDDLGAVFAVIDWALRKNESTPLMGGSIRISAVLRRANERWRLCHYAEAPVAPLVELRRFYQKIAADGHQVSP